MEAHAEIPEPRLDFAKQQGEGRELQRCAGLGDKARARELRDKAAHIGKKPKRQPQRFLRHKHQRPCPRLPRNLGLHGGEAGGEGVKVSYEVWLGGNGRVSCHCWRAVGRKPHAPEPVWMVTGEDRGRWRGGDKLGFCSLVIKAFDQR